MTLLLLVHILISIVLIVLVFIQYGRGGDMGASIGGGGSANSVFGASGSADFVSKATGVVGILFFISTLSIGAAYKHLEKADHGEGGGLMQGYVTPAAPKPQHASVPEKSNAIPVQPSTPAPSTENGASTEIDKSKAIPVQKAPEVSSNKEEGVAKHDGKAESVSKEKVSGGAKNLSPATVTVSHKPQGNEQLNELEKKTK